MTVLLLRPARETDLESMSRILYRSFLRQMEPLFEGVDEAEYMAFRRAQIRRHYASSLAHPDWVKIAVVVSSDATLLQGFAIWYIEPAFSNHVQEEDRAMPSFPSAGAGAQAYRTFGRAMSEKKQEIMGSRPHCCESKAWRGSSL